VARMTSSVLVPVFFTLSMSLAIVGTASAAVNTPTFTDGATVQTWPTPGVPGCLPDVTPNWPGALISVDTTAPVAPPIQLCFSAVEDAPPVAPPTIAKAFGDATIPLNGATSLSFTLQNPNATVALTGVAFSDTLPAGLVISTPNGLTGSCGGSVTAAAGTGLVSLTGGTVAAGAACTFSVSVSGTTAGDKNNTTGNVGSGNGGAGNTASASTNVVAPPTIAKVFTPATITAGAATTLTFTLTNPAENTVALTGVAFTDILPVGLGVPTGVASACGGTLTTTSPGSIVLAGGTLGVGSQCQFSVTVLDVAVGNFTTTTGSVTAANGGAGGTASANLVVLMRPLIPTLSGWALALLAGLLVLAGMGYLRRRQG